jgi:hypothetical protein
MINLLLHTRFGTFVVAIMAGLSLSLAIGAFAFPSSSPAHHQKRQAAGVTSDAVQARLLPDRSLMSVFSRPVNARDVLPADGLDQANQLSNAQGVDPSILPGQLETSQARIVATLPNGWSLYAVPSSKGYMCSILVGPNAGGGCFLGYLPGSNVLAGRSMDSYTQYVYGFVNDGVVNATVEQDGVARAVAIASNGFFYRADKPSSVLDTMVLHLQDGSTQTVNFGSWQVPLSK